MGLNFKARTKQILLGYFVVFIPKFIYTPFLFGNTSRENAANDYTSRANEDMNQQFSNYDEVNRLNNFFNYYCNLFVKENNYQITSFIAHQNLYFNTTTKTGIFAYPSVALLLHTINFAIAPDTVKKKMFLNRIFSIKLNKVSVVNSKMEINFNTYLKVGKPLANDIILWEENDNAENIILELFPP
jgi:hypothetical protein